MSLPAKEIIFSKFAGSSCKIAKKQTVLRVLVWVSMGWDESSLRLIYSEFPLSSKIERFAKTVNGFEPLTIFTKRSILGV